MLTDTKETNRLRKLAGELLGTAYPGETARLSNDYGMAAYGKGANKSGRAQRFYRAIVQSHQFRGQVMKWWLIDRKEG